MEEEHKEEKLNLDDPKLFLAIRQMIDSKVEQMSE